MNGFIYGNQYFELQLETYWKPVRLIEQWCNTGILDLPITAYDTAPGQLQIPSDLQGQPLIEQIAVIYSRSDQGMI